MDIHPNAENDVLAADGLRAGETGAPHLIRTDRLGLRRVHPDRVEFDRLHALFADLEDPGAVFEQCGWVRHEDEADTRGYLDGRIDRWNRGEMHEYVVATEGEYVGTACIEVRDDGSCEFGYWLRKPHWGRGLAPEGAEALVHVAFHHLEAPFVVAGCLATNEASRRAIESFVRRFGGSYVGSPPTVPSSSDGGGERTVVPHHEWVVTRAQFDAGESGLSTLVPGIAYEDLAF